MVRYSGEDLGHTGRRAAYRGVPLDMLQYVDVGCAVSPKCVECPLDRCIEELPWRVRARILAEYRKGPGD
jgi:hypothetical protein